MHKLIILILVFFMLIVWIYWTLKIFYKIIQTLMVLWILLGFMFNRIS